MCLFALIGLIVPRGALAALWLLSDRLAVLQPWWLGLLGFLFLPYTTLTYVLIHWHSGDVAGVMHLVLLGIAAGADLGVWGGTRKGKDDD